MQVKYQKIPKDILLPSPATLTPSDCTVYEYPEPYVKDKPMSKFWLQCYSCGLVANVGDHKVDVVEERVTLSPSILCPRCTAHYYIRDGFVVG